MYSLLLDIPTIPDWISAIAALAGVFFGGITLWKLLVRDKDKQQQLDALKSIVEIQADINKNLESQVIQLTNQTVEFQDQTKLMYELNKIILGYSLREEEKAKLVRKEQLLKIKPWFKIVNNTSAQGCQFILNLENRKSPAHEPTVEVIVGSDVSFKIFKVNNLENSQTVPLVINAVYGKYRENLSDLTFETKLCFKDVNENPYYQKITKAELYNIGEPILIE